MREVSITLADIVMLLTAVSITIAVMTGIGKLMFASYAARIHALEEQHKSDGERLLKLEAGLNSSISSVATQLLELGKGFEDFRILAEKRVGQQNLVLEQKFNDVRQLVYSLTAAESGVGTDSRRIPRFRKNQIDTDDSDNS